MKKIIITLSLVITLLAGIYFYREYRESQIPMAAPTKGPIVEAVYGLGTVVSSKTYRQTFGVALPLLQVLVREGEEVKQGTPLVKTENGISKAPFDGTVTSIPFKEGELIPPQSPVITLVDYSRPYLEVSLEQQAALRVQKGQKATLTFESLRGQKFEGSVRTLFPKDGQFLVHIDIDKLPEGVLIGMTADTAIEVGKKEEAMLIPVSAISSGKVVVLRGNKKIKVDVTVGVVDGEKAEITGGDLKWEDQVVLRKK